LRLVSGEEALVARVLTRDRKTGYGFSFDLDAAAARHMAEWHAGVRKERPQHRPSLDHPWERAWATGEPIDWNLEPGLAGLRWIP
jgi:hypothetical protein